jgi:hypothetical protein
VDTDDSAGLNRKRQLHIALIRLRLARANRSLGTTIDGPVPHA